MNKALDWKRKQESKNSKDTSSNAEQIADVFVLLPEQQLLKK
ncbi:hypothetical protein ACOI1C_00625 [Bacillus sp. DJP31]